jgi:protein-disulfide isomerase
MILTLLAAAAAVPTANTPVGWVIGSPRATRSLVEYGSLNCGHCAAFSNLATPTVMAAVRAGQIRFEYRPFLVFPHDVAATLVARCVATPRRFEFVERYYRDGATFNKRMEAAAPVSLEAARAKGDAAFNRTVVGITGIKTLAARFGLTGAAVDRCVSDPKGLAWINGAFQKAQAAGVTGTPTFFLDGKRAEFGSLDEVTAALK